jgi:hypothetical protein
VLSASAQPPQQPSPADIRCQRLKDLPAKSYAYLTTFNCVQGSSWLAETELVAENNSILAKILYKGSLKYNRLIRKLSVYVDKEKDKFTRHRSSEEIRPKSYIRICHIYTIIWLENRRSGNSNQWSWIDFVKIKTHLVWF